MNDPLHPLFKRLGFHTLWQTSHQSRGHAFILGRPGEETTARGAGVDVSRGTAPHAELGSKLVDARTHQGSHPNQMRSFVRHSKN